MRTVFFIGLCLLSGFIGTAQTASLPTWLIDSAIYEITRGRQCSQVTAAQALEIESLNKELNANDTAIKLQQRSNETLSALLNNSKESNSIQALQFQKDLSEQKRKAKRWRKVAVIQTLGIVVLIILTL